MRMALIGRAREPAECLRVGTRHTDTGRIERAEIELRLVVAGLRRPQIAARHVLIGCRIGLRAGRACQEGTAEYRQNGPLHGNAPKHSMSPDALSRRRLEALSSRIG